MDERPFLRPDNVIYQPPEALRLLGVKIRGERPQIRDLVVPFLFRNGKRTGDGNRGEERAIKPGRDDDLARVEF